MRTDGDVGSGVVCGEIVDVDDKLCTRETAEDVKRPKQTVEINKARREGDNEEPRRMLCRVLFVDARSFVLVVLSKTVSSSDSEHDDDEVGNS